MISGKVNMLSYNRSFADQYYQRYDYDADNRIVGVESSADGILWDKDARYEYYQHGPLARMTMGHQFVQGLDYAYTIQGWLKAVNGDLLDTLMDMGGDGTGNLVTAPDAVAFSLDYFIGDYRPIGTTEVAHILTPTKSLYNGNIPRSTMAIIPFENLSTEYTYDQLNRIVKADYASIAEDGSLTSTADYYSKYAYDPDGNLQTLVRNGNLPASQRMDSLIYRYATGGNNNQLLNVNDYAADNYNNDIRYNTNAVLSRYLYDKTGNLTKDLVSGQDTIQWSHYGKVTHALKDSLGNGLTFDYDGAGHRYLKTNNTLSGDTSIYNQTYSVRDAQGNILAIYNSESVYRKQKREWVLELAQDIIAGSGLPTYVNNFLVPLYGQDGHFKQFLFKDALKQPAWTGGQLTAQPVSWFVVKNKAVKSNMLSQSGMYPQMFKEMARYSDSGAHPMLAAGLDSLLRTRNEWNLFAQSVFGFDHEAFDVSIRELAGAKLCLDPAFGKGFLEHFGYPVDEPEWANHMPALLAEMEEQGRGAEFTERFQNLAEENREGVQHFLDGMVSDTTLMSYGPYVNSLEDGVLLFWFNQALGQYTSSLRLGAFMDTWSGSRKLMNSSNDTASLLTVVYDDDESAYLNSWAATAGNDRLAYALAALPDLQLPVVLDQAQALLNYNPSIFILNVLKYQRTHLAAHVLYGSSRLGTKDYLAGEHYLLRDYTGPSPIVDTMTLSGRVPWYSHVYHDAIKDTASGPFGNTFTGNYGVTHAIGQKQYEISNHASTPLSTGLGNVQATISDLKYPIGKPYGEITSRLPALRAAYDYYPFGMLMPDRYVSDTSTHCVTVLQQKWLWRWVTVSCWDQTNWVWPGYTSIGNGQAQIYDGEIEIAASKDLDGVSFRLPVTAGVDHQLTLKLSLLENTGAGTSVQVRAFQNDEWEILASSELRLGMQFLKFTPSLAAQVELVFVGPVRASVVQICLEKWTLVQDQVLVDVCDGDKDWYRFGFNGMLKDNELKGIGNSLDFGARIYDSRIGRFLSLDPLAQKYPSESNYTFAGNSPIYLIDKGGKYKVPAANEEAYNKTYPLIMKYLSTQVESDISNSTKIINGLISTNPNITSNTVKGISKWGFGPEVVFKDAPGEFPMEFKGAAGYTEKDGHVIQMNAGYAKYVEKVLASDASPKVKQAAFMRFYMTLVHETGHELNKYGKSMGQNAQGNDTYQTLPKGRSSDEQGFKAEENIWGTDKYKPFSSPNLDDSEGEQGISSEKYKKGVTEGVINEANKTEEGRKSLPTVPTQ